MAFANYQFRLKEPNKNHTSIRLLFYKGGKPFYYGTGLSINPKFWNSEDQRPTADKKLIKRNKKEYPQL